MPPRKKKVVTNTRERADIRRSTDKQEPVKPTLEPGSGWTQESYLYLRTIEAAQLDEELYKVFGLPLEYMKDERQVAAHVFIEFNHNSYAFAQQYSDPSKAIKIIAILSDYLGFLPTIPTPLEAFTKWVERATVQIESLDFTPNEIAAFMKYINGNLKPTSHILHFTLTSYALQNCPPDISKLFRPVFVEVNETREIADDQPAEDAQETEPETQQQMLAQAIKEKKEAEERQLQEELTAALEEIVTTNYAKIQQSVDSRYEQILQTLSAAEDRIEGPQKRK